MSSEWSFRAKDTFRRFYLGVFSEDKRLWIFNTLEERFWTGEGPKTSYAGVFTIGRNPYCDIVLSDRILSTNHVNIEWRVEISQIRKILTPISTSESNGFYGGDFVQCLISIRDKSSNGTFLLSGERLKKENPQIISPRIIEDPTSNIFQRTDENRQPNPDFIVLGKKSITDPPCFSFTVCIFLCVADFLNSENKNCVLRYFPEVKDSNSVNILPGTRDIGRVKAEAAQWSSLTTPNEAEKIVDLNRRVESTRRKISDQRISELEVELVLAKKKSAALSVKITALTKERDDALNERAAFLEEIERAELKRKQAVIQSQTAADQVADLEQKLDLLQEQTHRELITINTQNKLLQQQILDTNSELSRRENDYRSNLTKNQQVFQDYKTQINQILEETRNDLNIQANLINQIGLAVGQSIQRIELISDDQQNRIEQTDDEEELSNDNNTVTSEDSNIVSPTPTTLKRPSSEKENNYPREKMARQ